MDNVERVAGEARYHSGLSTYSPYAGVRILSLTQVSKFGKLHRI